jgi:hypothetical protein
MWSQLSRLQISIKCAPIQEIEERVISPQFKVSLYRRNQNSVNWIVICALKYVINFFITTEFTKIIRNHFLHVQCTIHKAVIPLYKLTGRFTYEYWGYYYRIFKANWPLGHSVIYHSMMCRKFEMSGTSGMFQLSLWDITHEIKKKELYKRERTLIQIFFSIIGKMEKGGNFCLNSTLYNWFLTFRTLSIIDHCIPCVNSWFSPLPHYFRAGVYNSSKCYLRITISVSQTFGYE